MTNYRQAAIEHLEKQLDAWEKHAEKSDMEFIGEIRKRISLIDRSQEFDAKHASDIEMFVREQIHKNFVSLYDQSTHGRLRSQLESEIAKVERGPSGSISRAFCDIGNAAKLLSATMVYGTTSCENEGDAEKTMRSFESSALRIIVETLLRMCEPWH